MLLSARTLLFSRHALGRNKLSAEANLCAIMQQLSITSHSPPFHLTRSFHTTATIFHHKSHLDSSGAIKAEYLNQRREFLKNYQLLRDQTTFENRVVYENRDLYDVHDIDKYGLTNLQRMLKGLAPVASNGTDHVVIHHFDQTHNGEWVVLLNSFHEEHDLSLHSQVKVRNGVNRQMFAKERMAYWQHVANTHLLKKTISGIRKK